MHERGANAPLSCEYLHEIKSDKTHVSVTWRAKYTVRSAVNMVLGP